MNLDTYITLDDVRCKVDVSNKKNALVVLSSILSSGLEDVCQDSILGKLKERERLGSTGLGAGIAIPHCRVKDLVQARLAFITLDTPIDYDAVDNKPVDMLFCLVVPENCNDTHLQILAYLANMLSDKSVCHELRHCTDEIALYQYITHWTPLSNNSTAVGL